ncbi:MAG: ABC transporter substrate-binding protein, partial [Candidatus Bathyarchaeota archaeon]|nr:ABC transporter substrate-binding protein [Candidatus Bathyarchaeota archaeon]
MVSFPKKSSILLGLLCLTTILFFYHVVSGAEAETVNIGVIWANEDWASFSEPIVSLAEQDINQYMIENGYNYQFEFVYKNAYESPETHLEKIIELDEEGINLVIGCTWSRFADGSVEYANENDMVIISPSSTAEGYDIKDNFFRLVPTEDSKNPVLGELMWSQGKKVCIIIGPDQALENPSIEDTLQQLDIEYTMITYEETGEPIDFSSFAAEVETQVREFGEYYSFDEITIYMHALSYWRISEIANSLNGYETMQDVIWYVNEELIESNLFHDDLDPDSTVFKFYFPHVYLEDSAQYRDVNERYISIVGSDLGLYNATLYDTCWLYAYTILEAESQNTLNVLNQLPLTAANHNGITGTWLLDAGGDRISPDYSIMGLADSPEITFQKYAYYNTRTSEIIWTYETGLERAINPEIHVETNGPYSGNILSGEGSTDIYFTADGTYLLTGDIKSYKWSFGDGS